MAKSVRKKAVREAALSEVKDDLSRYLREAERVRRARASLRSGRGTWLEELD